MKCPCKKNCERRSATCRLDRAAYGEYADHKMAEYARNAARSNANAMSPAQKSRLRERDKMRKEGRIR